MQKLLTIFKSIPNKIKIVAALSIVTFGLIWFGLPHLKIDGSYPFSSIIVRILICAMLLITWNSKVIVSFIAQHKSKVFSIIFTRTKSVKEKLTKKSQSAWKTTKIQTLETKAKLVRDHKRRSLRKLPWYAVMGTPHSGKHTMLKNSGLIFARPEHFGEGATNYIEYAPDTEWWFSEEAIFINTMSGDSESNHRGWKQLIKILKRDRKTRPLNGIILNFSIKDLIVFSNQKRQNFIQETCEYLRMIHNQFKSLVPIYIIFTQCDLIEGFMEFFNDLSKDELKQIWGFTFPLAQSSDQQAVHTIFNEQYTDLIQQLRKRVMWSLDTERTERGRELITAFPQQMQLLKKPINDFIGELFGVMRYHRAIQLRGVYFTSCTQEQGERIDLLMQAMSKKFNLIPPKHQQVQRIGECYFMQNIFHAIIKPESSMLGFSTRKKKLNNILYKLSIFGLPILGAATIVGMHYGYTENQQNLTKISAYITNYNNALSNITTSDGNVINTLPALTALNKATLLYKDNPYYGVHFLFMSHVIAGDLNSALMRSLHSIFLPRIAAKLEQNLNQNMTDMNLLYATFKGYLAFSSTATVSGTEIEPPIKLQWAKQFIETPDTEAQLRYFLKLAVTKPIEKLPLNTNLTDNIRSKLEKIIPSNRAYGLLQLQAKVSNIAPINLNSVVGSGFNKIFTLQNTNMTIPALYTKTGFKKIFLKNDTIISRSVASDNQDIGLSSNNDASESWSEIQSYTQKEYGERYTAYWMKALSNLQISKFKTLANAIDSLNIISGKSSPVAKLLTIVYENTKSINSGGVQVTKSFEALNDYSHSIMGSNWNSTIKTLVNVRNYLFKLERSANPNEAAFNAAKIAIQKGAESPIQQLTIDAQNAPEPIKSWLLSIANNTWSIVTQSAHIYMNNMWEKDVIADYNNGISGRYPLIASAQSQVDIANFNAFFGPGGDLNTYFNLYLKPFINTSTQKWHLYKVNNHTIEIPTHVVDSFQKGAQIKNDFFPNATKMAKFSFSIQPITLDSSASSIRFRMGPQLINYSFGPREITQVTWPLPINDQTTTLNISDFKGGNYSKSASGPWALFKIFNFGLLKRTKNNGTYTLLINLHGYHASFQITGSNNQPIFTLKDLKGFKLPQDIAKIPTLNSNWKHKELLNAY